MLSLLDEIGLSDEFVRPDANDTEFKYWPYKAKVMLNRFENDPGMKQKPFSDYALRFYNKYDKESFEIAVEWNSTFSQTEIDRENKLDKKLRKEKD